MEITDAISKRNDGSWEYDTAAFLPDPQGYIKIKGEEYPIFSFLDLPVEEALAVIKMHERIRGIEDPEARMAESIAHLVKLNQGPDEGREGRKLITVEQLKKLTPRTIVTLVTVANSIAAVPLKADPSASESVSSAPESAVSMDGPTAK